MDESRFPDFGDGFPDDIKERLRALRESLNFETAVPTMVCACFADLRRSAEFVQAAEDSRNSDSLKRFYEAYYDVFSQAIQKALKMRLAGLRLACTGGACWKLETEFMRLLIPAVKPLGDGMMMVWDLPRQPREAFGDLFKLVLLDIVSFIQASFVSRFRWVPSFVSRFPGLAGTPYPPGVRDLCLGFGLTYGDAYRLDFGAGHRPDYVGSIIDLAARLQAYADPQGVVATKAYAPEDFGTLQRHGHGEFTKLKDIKGWNRPVEVWQSKERVMPLVSSRFTERQDAGRKKWLVCGMDSDALIPRLSHEFLKGNAAGRLQLVVPENCTLENLLELRAAVEVVTVRKLARLCRKNDQKSGAMIASLKESIRAQKTAHGNNDGDEFKKKGKEFHLVMAESAWPEQQEQRKLIDTLFDKTAEKYLEARLVKGQEEGVFNEAYRTEVLAEHSKIVNAITKGSSEAAEAAICKHLSEEGRRARALALSVET